MEFVLFETSSLSRVATSVQYHEITMITFDKNDNVNKYKNLQFLCAAEAVH